MRKEPLRRLIAAAEQAELVGMERSIDVLTDKSFLNNLGNKAEQHIKKTISQEIFGKSSGT